MQTEICRVGDWPQDEDFPVFPAGSQPKVLLTCPEDLISSEFIPRHKYLFKTPRGWQDKQIWSELIAYEIARLVGVEVPRCFVATDGAGQLGALVEFFYNYPSSPYTERFLHGSDLLQRFITDKKKGRPHGISTNVRLTRRYGVPDAPIRWGKILAFDALIGNTDRHPENWGLVRRFHPGLLPNFRLAPAFDNATSLGYERSEQAVADLDARRIERYVNRGSHHCGWSPADDKRGQHVALCVRFAEFFQEASEAMKNVIRFDMQHVREILDRCVSLGGPLPLSVHRARFIGDLIRVRQVRLAEALGV